MMANLIDRLLKSPYGLWIALGLLIIGFIGAVLLIVNIIYLAYKKTLMSAASRIGGKVIYNLWDGPYLSLKHDNAETRISIRGASKNNPPSLLIQRTNPLPFTLSILSASSPQMALYQLLCKGEKIKTQDSVLDEKLIIKSDAPNQAELFLQNSERKDAINSLLENGYEKIIAKKNKIMIQKYGYSDEDFNPETVNKVINNISSFTP